MSTLSTDKTIIVQNGDGTVEIKPKVARTTSGDMLNESDLHVLLAVYEELLSSSDEL